MRLGMILATDDRATTALVLAGPAKMSDMLGRWRSLTKETPPAGFPVLKLIDLTKGTEKRHRVRPVAPTPLQHEGEPAPAGSPVPDSPPKRRRSTGGRSDHRFD